METNKRKYENKTANWEKDGNLEQRIEIFAKTTPLPIWEQEASVTIREFTWAMKVTTNNKDMACHT